MIKKIKIVEGTKQESFKTIEEKLEVVRLKINEIIGYMEKWEE